MFEQRKTITVNGVTFNMILVEGDKFSIGEKEYEVDDFYMAEFPVTQELYMAVMGPAHTGSYNMMPDNFDYLEPKRFSIYGNVINRNESIEDYKNRLDREWQEKRNREEKERDRIRKLSASLPVNNVSWIEAINFIKKLNDLTGLNFALPSFEQWYFAASGGIESKGYAFAGSDDANTVGHFHKLSTITKSEGLFVMSDGKQKKPIRKAASSQFSSPGKYNPNELGLFDMSGLVYEWLDKAGEVIGGSYFSNPDNVCKNRRYGYAQFNLADGSPDMSIYSDSTIKKRSEYLLGFRLILSNNRKLYEIPKVPTVLNETSYAEQRFIDTLYRMPDLGLLRTIISQKYVKPRTIKNYKLPFDPYAYSRFHGNVYNVFLCPQNLSSFSGDCFSVYLSRRKFINHCKKEFISLLNKISDAGYSLLIEDKLGLNLTEMGCFTTLQVDLSNCKFRTKKSLCLANVLSEHHFVTNNPDLLTINQLSSFSKNPSAVYDNIELSPMCVLVEIKESFSVQKEHEINDEWLYTISFSPKNRSNSFRISLNCFCDFNNGNDIIKSMKQIILYDHDRINNEDFDNTERVNQLFCKQNKGGLYEYNYPPSSGVYEIQDERFFILPQPVYDEWRQSLKP